VLAETKHILDELLSALLKPKTDQAVYRES